VALLGAHAPGALEHGAQFCNDLVAMRRVAALPLEQGLQATLCVG